MKHNILSLASLTLALVSFSSCGEWLDVQPKTSIEQDDLFSNEYGFKDALTGAYIKLGNTALYGQDMSYSYLDMLAGLYESAPQMYDWSTVYAYDGTYKGTVNAIYSSSYNIIANLNNLIKFIDIKKHIVTTPDYYETIKGEALGLRAFLHFDLLRLFGPVYKDDPQGLSVPYRVEFNNVATPLLPASEVIDLCIKDLKEAEELLEGHDSEIFTFSESADAFTEMRQMRMNVWAVRAMLARVYCYKGDAESKALALEYAKAVIASGKFSLASYSEVQAHPNNPSEHIFSIYIDDYYQILDPVFKDADASVVLAAYESTLKIWYESVSDARYKAFTRVSSERGYKAVMQKYNQSLYGGGRGTYVGANAQPLIRLAEMYYIAAECEPDATESAKFLNAVITERTGRYNATTTLGYDQTDTRSIYGMVTGQTVRVNELLKEYLKEYYGEGQLFYFYKRFGFSKFSNCPISNMMQTRGSLTYYQFPIPDDEITFGNSNSTK